MEDNINEDHLFSITAKRIEDLGYYSRTLLDNNIIFHICGERRTSHSIFYTFTFKTTNEKYKDILKKLNIRERRE